jgi:hypothetical protein
MDFITLKTKEAYEEFRDPFFIQVFCYQKVIAKIFDCVEVIANVAKFRMIKHFKKSVKFYKEDGVTGVNPEKLFGNFDAKKDFIELKKEYKYPENREEDPIFNYRCLNEELDEFQMIIDNIKDYKIIKEINDFNNIIPVYLPARYVYTCTEIERSQYLEGKKKRKNDQLDENQNFIKKKRD